MNSGPKDLAKLNSRQFGRLNLEEAVALIPMGLIEEHGPHLPLGTDTFIVNGALRHIIDEVSRRWQDQEFIILPGIEWGTQPVDDLVLETTTENRTSFHSIPIASQVLRSLIVDIGRAAVKRGLRYIFLVNRHGGPLHIESIEQACRFVREVDVASMFHVRLGTNGERLREAWEHMTKEEKEALGEGFLDLIEHEIHAGFIETSAMLFLYPELVDPIYTGLPDIPVPEHESIYRIPNEKTDWMGYFGYPSKALRSFGRAIVLIMARDVARSIMKVIDGGVTNLSELREVGGSARMLRRRRLISESTSRTQLSQWLENEGSYD